MGPQINLASARRPGLKSCRVEIITTWIKNFHISAGSFHSSYCGFGIATPRWHHKAEAHPYEEAEADQSNDACRCHGDGREEEGEQAGQEEAQGDDQAGPGKGMLQ